jgi:cytoskeletal protein RodZ
MKKSYIFLIIVVIVIIGIWLWLDQTPTSAPTGKETPASDTTASINQILDEINVEAADLNAIDADLNSL